MSGFKCTDVPAHRVLEAYGSYDSQRSVGIKLEAYDNKVVVYDRVGGLRYHHAFSCTKKQAKKIGDWLYALYKAAEDGGKTFASKKAGKLYAFWSEGNLISVGVEGGRSLKFAMCGYGRESLDIADMFIEAGS